MKAVDTSVRCSLSKERVPEKYLRSDEMLTALMSVSLFHVIFITRYEIKSLSPQKKRTILSCQML